MELKRQQEEIKKCIDCIVDNVIDDMDRGFRIPRNHLWYWQSLESKFHSTILQENINKILNKNKEHKLIQNIHSKDSINLQENINSKDISLRIKTAMQSNLSEQQFLQLAEDENILVRATVAKNIYTPVRVLELLSLPKYGVRHKLPKNSSLPEHLFKKLATDRKKFVRASVAKSIHTPTEILELLSSPQYRVRYEIAQNPNTPISVLRELSHNKHIKVAYRLASNPSTPAYILTGFFYQIKDLKIKYKLATNPNTPADILSQLSRIDNIKLKNKLATNPKLKYPSKIDLEKQAYELLLSYSNVQRYSKRTPLSYLRLCNLAVLFNSHAEEKVLSNRSNSIYWLERYAVAIHPNTLQAIRNKLTQDSNIIVRNSAFSLVRRISIMEER